MRQGPNGGPAAPASGQRQTRSGMRLLPVSARSRLEVEREFIVAARRWCLGLAEKLALNAPATEVVARTASLPIPFAALSRIAMRRPGSSFVLALMSTRSKPSEVWPIWTTMVGVVAGPVVVVLESLICPMAMKARVTPTARAGARTRTLTASSSRSLCENDHGE